jgi:hypothetical protein
MYFKSFRTKNLAQFSQIINPYSTLQKLSKTKNYLHHSIVYLKLVIESKLALFEELGTFPESLFRIADKTK